MSDRREIRTELDALLCALGTDELRTLRYLAERLLEGQRLYGAVDLANDPRDFLKERAEELGDALIYTAFAELKRRTKDE